MLSSYIPLNVHSNYSLLYGTIAIKDLVARAKECGYQALALTDINNLYGIHTFIDCCNQAGIRPIIGTDLRFGDGRALLWAKDRTGLNNLFHLLSKLVTSPHYFSPLKDLSAHHQGLVIATATPEWLRGLSGLSDIYALLTNRQASVINMAAQLGLPLLAAPPITLMGAADYPFHQVLRAMALHTTVSRLPPAVCCQKDDLFFTAAELEAKFGHAPAALENILQVADLCQQQTIFDHWVFPQPLDGNGQDMGQLLRRRVLSAIAARGLNPSPSFNQRLEYELELIISKGFAPYFLVVADIVSHTKRTCGRGSGAASLVAYLLGITNVDPLEHNLYFDRFLNPDRQDPPDIDIDLAWDERDNIINTIIQKYGPDHCAMVANHVTFQGAAALREVARVMGITTAEINQTCTLLAQMQRVKEAQKGTNGYKDPAAYQLELPSIWPTILQQPGSPWPMILEMARRLTTFPRHLGLHAGGLIITPGDISYYAPIAIAAKGVPVITWEKDGTEAAGLIKMDLLGNRSLAVVRDALDNLSLLGLDLDTCAWPPISDQATINLLASGQTMGIFYVESPAMRQLQQKSGCGDFDHLVIHSSIIRPAANRYINEYVERLHGKPYTPLTPEVGQLFAETYGIMCYQEDVSRAAVALADFSTSEADKLRKILTKKDRELRLPQYRGQFFTGAAKRGIPTAVCEQIWQMMLSFDGYSFCKAHSASYAMLSFQSAYLKAHHPAPFMAAVISNNGGYYSRLSYISESQRLGITILPPSINNSPYKFTALSDRVMRVGLMAIRRLSLATCQQIITTRETWGPYRDIADLLQRVNMSSVEAQSLAASGALDELAPGCNRTQLQWQIALAQQRLSLPRQQEFSFSDSTPVCRTILPRGHKDHPLDLLWQEYRELGFLCKSHPLILYKQLLSGLKTIPAVKLPRYCGQEISLIGWPVSRKPVMTAKGQPMEFFSFEDQTAIYETVLFPQAYAQFTTALDYLCPYLLNGRVEEDHGAYYLNIKNVIRLVNDATARAVA